MFLLVYLHMHAVALTKKTLFLPARGWVSAGLPLPRESLADEFQSASGLSLAVRPIAIRLWQSAGKRGGLEACAILHPCAKQSEAGSTPSSEAKTLLTSFSRCRPGSSSDTEQVSKRSTGLTASIVRCGSHLTTIAQVLCSLTRKKISGGDTGVSRPRSTPSNKLVLHVSRPAEAFRPTFRPALSRFETKFIQPAAERIQFMSGVPNGVGPAVQLRGSLYRNAGASSKAQLHKGPPRQSAEDPPQGNSSILPPEGPEFAGVQIPAQRCNEKGCVFPAAWRDSGKCRQHDRQRREPALFHSRQPSTLLLDQAKFGVADGQAEIHGNRLKDRRRLARLWETFLEGAA